MKDRSKNSIFKELRQGYDEDMANYHNLLDNFLKFSIEDLNKLKEALRETPAGMTLIELVEEATKQKRDPIKSIKSQGRQRLGKWAQARISDRAVKMLFKELIGAYRQHINQ